MNLDDQDTIKSLGLTMLLFLGLTVALVVIANLVGQVK